MGARGPCRETSHSTSTYGEKHVLSRSGKLKYSMGDFNHQFVNIILQAKITSMSRWIYLLLSLHFCVIHQCSHHHHLSATLLAITTEIRPFLYIVLIGRKQYCNRTITCFVFLKTTTCLRLGNIYLHG